MPDYFHVHVLTMDGGGYRPTVQPGDTLTPGPPAFETHPGGRDASARLLPGGVTRHGDRYLGTQPNPNDPNAFDSWSIEAFFEAVRRADAPTKPSRFASVFALESIDQARAFAWRHRLGHPYVTLRVRSEVAHRGNMELLKLPGLAVADAFTFAQDYWAGRQGLAAAFWEILLPGAVEVLEVVDDPLGIYRRQAAA